MVWSHTTANAIWVLPESLSNVPMQIVQMVLFHFGKFMEFVFFYSENGTHLFDQAKSTTLCGRKQLILSNARHMGNPTLDFRPGGNGNYKRWLRYFWAVGKTERRRRLQRTKQVQWTIDVLSEKRLVGKCFERSKTVQHSMNIPRQMIRWWIDDSMWDDHRPHSLLAPD